MGLGNHSGSYHEGDHAAVCDICGFRFRRSQLAYNWKQQLVCANDWEPRNPQEYAVHPRADIQGVPNPRPRGEPTFIPQYYEGDGDGSIPAITGAGILTAT